MKKLTYLLVVLIITLSCTCGCVPSSDASKKDAPNIATSFYPMYIFTKSIVGDSNGLAVTMFAPPGGGCIHDFAPGPRDIETLTTAAAFVINGGGMESFMDKVVRDMPSLKIIDSSQNIETIYDNPHFWLSPRLAAKQAQTIADALCELDASNAEIYRANCDAFAARLQELSEQMRLALTPLKGYKIMVLHEAFEYFAEEFELDMITCTYDETIGLSPAQIEQIILEVKTQNIAALCCDKGEDSSIAELISREADVPLYKLNTITDGPVDPNTYFTLMGENVETLTAIPFFVTQS